MRVISLQIFQRYFEALVGGESSSGLGLGKFNILSKTGTEKLGNARAIKSAKLNVISCD